MLFAVWPACAGNLAINVTPLAPETAIAINTAAPTDVKAPPGSAVSLPLAVKNLSVSEAVYVNVVAHDAVAVNAGDSNWTLTAADPPGPDQYGVTFNGAPVPPGGYKGGALGAAAAADCALGVRLPAAMTGRGPRVVKVDVYGSSN